MQKNNRNILYLIFGIALLLRMSGINHGFPFIFHPDEPAVIRTALGIRFYLNPGHFDWPHLYMYMNYFLYMGFSFVRQFATVIGYKPFLSTFLPVIWNEDTIFYLLTRMLTAFLGALTVIPVYLTGKRLFNEKVGMYAALGLAIIPFHVWQSHYALIDVPAAFFIACSMYFAAGILQHDDAMDYAGAGTYIGLAASTKYNGGLGAFSVPLAHFIRVLTLKEKKISLRGFGQLALSGLMAFLAFVLGTPYAVLDYSTFSRTDGPKGAFWQFHNVGSVNMSERIPKFVNDMTFKLSDDLGYTVLIAFVLVFLILFIRAGLRRVQEEDKYLWFLTISGMGLLFYISGFDRSRSQYFLIAYPYIAVVFGYFAYLIEKTFRQRSTIIGSILLIVLFAVPSYMSIVYAYKFYNSDTRNVLYTWLKANIKPNQTIQYSTSDVVPVLEKLPNTKVKSVRTGPTFNGYFIVSSDEDVTVPTNLKQVVSISNKYRLGPYLWIYTQK